MSKIIYFIICLLDVLFFVVLAYKANRRMKKDNLRRINSVPLLVKFIGIAKFLVFAFTPFLHLIILWAELLDIYTPDGLKNGFDEALENYAKN